MNIFPGQRVYFKPEFMDFGDDDITFLAIDASSKGRVTVEGQLGMTINPTHVVSFDMIERVE